MLKRGRVERKKMMGLVGGMSSYSDEKVSFRQQSLFVCFVYDNSF